MNEGLRDRVRDFYRRYIPVGDRIGEMFYATWMIVVSLGIINSVENSEELVPVAIAVAFGVNIGWGLIDGVSVMYSGVIDRARTEQLIFELQTKGDAQTRTKMQDALEEALAGALSWEQKEHIISQVAEGAPRENPRNKQYYPQRADWYYALGILAIDVAFVFPLIAPLVLIPDVHNAMLVSRLIATLIFAALGAAYAQQLHRRRWLAALSLGILGLTVSSLAYFLGW